MTQHSDTRFLRREFIQISALTVGALFGCSDSSLGSKNSPNKAQTFDEELKARLKEMFDAHHQEIGALASGTGNINYSSKPVEEAFFRRAVNEVATIVKSHSLEAAPPQYDSKLRHLSSWLVNRNLAILSSQIRPSMESDAVAYSIELFGVKEIDPKEMLTNELSGFISREALITPPKTFLATEKITEPLGAMASFAVSGLTQNDPNGDPYLVLFPEEISGNVLQLNQEGFKVSSKSARHLVMMNEYGHAAFAHKFPNLPDEKSVKISLFGRSTQVPVVQINEAYSDYFSLQVTEGAIADMFRIYYTHEVNPNYNLSSDLLNKGVDAFVAQNPGCPALSLPPAKFLVELDINPEYANYKNRLISEVRRTYKTELGFIFRDLEGLHQ